MGQSVVFDEAILHRGSSLAVAEPAHCRRQWAGCISVLCGFRRVRDEALAGEQFGDLGQGGVDEGDDDIGGSEVVIGDGLPVCRDVVVEGTQRGAGGFLVAGVDGIFDLVVVLLEQILVDVLDVELAFAHDADDHC
jgi:hypothetical protein